MAAYALDLSASPPTLTKDGAPVAMLDVHLSVFANLRFSISNPTPPQINMSLEARVDDSGQSPRPQHAPEHTMRSGPSDTIALVLPADPIAASVGPAAFALNSAHAIP